MKKDNNSVLAKNISFCYTKDSYVFKDYSFNFLQGDVVGIIGLNGKGKTTLLKCILNLYRVTYGDLVVYHEAGYVPQFGYSVFPYKVKDIVVTGCAKRISLFKSPSEKDFENVYAILDQLGIRTYADTPINKLSGGESRLVYIARAMMSQCKIIVLDEPTASLDYYNQNIILQNIRNLSNNSVTVIFTTHDPQHVISVCNKAMLMYSCCDEYDFGCVDKVMTNDNLSRLYRIPIDSDFSKKYSNHRSLVPVFTF